MAVTLDLVSKNSLPALGGNLTFKAPSTSQATSQQIFILNVGMLVNAGIYNLAFSNGNPTNVDYINLLDGDGNVIDSSFLNPDFSVNFNFNPSKPWAKLVLVSDNRYISWPANSNAIVASGLSSNTNTTPTITIPTTPVPELTNVLTTRTVGSTDYTWTYPTYNVSTNAYYAGKIVNCSTFASQDLYANNYRGASFAFDYVNNKMYIVGGGVYNSSGGVQSHSQTMYTSFKEKNMADNSFAETAKAAYPDSLNTMNILMAAPGDGNVYTFGQHYLETSNVPTSHYYGNLAYKWNGSTNTWSPIAKMNGFPSVSADETFIFSYQGKVYISGARYTAVDKGSRVLFDYWFGYYDPATNSYTTIKNFKTVGLSEGPSFTTLGNMNGRTYHEDANYLYDKYGKKYSKADYIATGFLPAPVAKPQYWAPTLVLNVANTPGNTTYYAHYLKDGSYYLAAQTQSQISVPSYASRV
jgi:hypothetical protein